MRSGNEDAGISAQNIRSVIAGEYAGGCFECRCSRSCQYQRAGNETSSDVPDAFRSYVYYGTVSEVRCRFKCQRKHMIRSGQNNQVTYSERPEDLRIAVKWFCENSKSNELK
ncbi:MAG: hypothetical protein ACLS8T_18845 [Anaerobutyricum sp.]